MIKPFGCYNDFNFYHLLPNTAVVQFEGGIGETLWIRSHDCANCSYYPLCSFKTTMLSTLFNSSSPTDYQVGHPAGLHNHTGSYWFKSQGTYRISRDNEVKIIDLPENLSNGFLTLLIFLAVFLLFEIISIDNIVLLGSKIRNKFRRRVNEEEDQLGEHFNQFECDPYGTTTSGARTDFIDAARGLAILLMIFVNYGGAGLSFMEHSPWNGLTVADVVFPLFMFIVGFTDGYFTIHRPFTEMRNWQILHRLARLFFIGFLLNASRSPSDFRVMGVLQRIALAHGLFYLIRLLLSSSFSHCQHVVNYQQLRSRPTVTSDSLDTSDYQQSQLVTFYTSYNMYKESIVILVIMTTMTVLQIFVQRPGCPRLYFGPGGISDYGIYENCTGGFNYIVDKLVFGEQHLYQRPTCKNLYFCKDPFDPEGLVGTILSMTNIFAGFLMAFVVKSRSSFTNISIFTVLSSLFYTGIGLALHFYIVPINKNLWTISYVFVNNAISSIIIYLFYSISQFRNYFNTNFLSFWTLRFAGRNPLTLYVLHIVLRGVFPINWTVSPDFYSQSLMSIYSISIYLLLSWILAFFGYSVHLERFRKVLI